MTILDQFKLNNKVALVTGSSRGIGKGIAFAMAQTGAQVVCSSRKQEEIETVAKEISSVTGQEVVGIQCDVSSADDRQKLVETALKHFGCIDILVNNAGGSPPNNPLKTTPDKFSHALNWNVVPAFDLSRLVAPSMQENHGGCIINISSAAARLRQKRFSAYGSAKAALSQLTRLLAQDFAPLIRVNGIEPGTIMTEALDKFLDPEKKQAVIESTPLKRLGTVEDVAASSVFLASSAASWITGKIIELDGGVEAPNW